MKHTTLLLVGTLLLASCGGRTNEALTKKSSSGKTQEVLLAANQGQYSGATKALLDSIFKQPQGCLPQPEPMFDVVSIPIAPAEMTGGDELVYLPAYIDIMQEYITRAMESEKVAYRGLKGICSKPIGPIYTDRQQAISAFLAGDAFANAKVVITSSSSNKRIEMVITTDTHELRGIRRKN